MPDGAAPPALLKLMTWLSPAFPVGAFSYSHGIERAIHDGVIDDRESLVGWLTEIVERGSGWNDAVLLVEAWRAVAEGRSCVEVAELAEAMAGSRERHIETTLQGQAFDEAIRSWVGAPPHPASASLGHPLPAGERRLAGGGTPRSVVLQCGAADQASSPQRGEGGRAKRRPGEGALAVPYPVAVGQTAADHGIALAATLTAYLHAFTSNLIQAAVRLVPLGQRDGVAAIAAMEPVILATATRAAQSTLDDLGSATFLSEIAGMKHEVQYSRVFRS